jgi:hypothetical protein
MIALMMEAASISETSVNFYQTTRRNNPEDSHLQGIRYLSKSSMSIVVFWAVMPCGLANGYYSFGETKWNHLTTMRTQMSNIKQFNSDIF